MQFFTNFGHLPRILAAGIHIRFRKEITLRSSHKILFMLFLGLILLSGEALAQGQKKMVQFTGLVVGGSQMYGIPGVNIYVPKAGRGTSTNQYGYFSLATLAGDSVAISSLAFKNRWFVIPDTAEESISVVIQLQADTLMLPVVEVLPYPTEELFKQAFVSLQLPDAERKAMEKNLDEDVLERMFYEMDMDGSMNHTYYMNQQITARSNKYMQPTVSLLNPFAWADFIKAVKRGDLKKKEWKKDD